MARRRTSRTEHAAMRVTWGPRSILLLVAVICFALATIGITTSIDLIALGLTLGFGAFLVGDLDLGRR
jgi:hypothetical protein